MAGALINIAIPPHSFITSPRIPIHEKTVNTTGTVRVQNHSIVHGEDRLTRVAAKKWEASHHQW